MVLQWFLFIVTVVVAYIGISWFAQLTGGSSHTAWSTFFSALRPLPLLVMIVANMFFGLGIYFGLGITRFAIPATIAMGVVTSFVYSVVMLGAQVTLTKIVGAIVVILGVAMLAL
jgi:hypothetical protein